MPVITDNLVPVLAFLGAGGTVLLVAGLSGRKQDPLRRRVDQLSEGNGGGGPPESRPFWLSRLASLFMPADERSRAKLAARLNQAGFYGSSAMSTFLAVRCLLMIGPPVVAWLVGLLLGAGLQTAVFAGAITGCCGMVLSGRFLQCRKRAHQTRLRRSLPDALDVVVICLEAGLSLEAALRRVASELNTAHPTLAREFAFIQRDLDFGRSIGEGMQRFGERCGLEEVQQLASAVKQAKKFGASMVGTLRVHSETLRRQRQQRAEEMARKTATKLLFPTLLFIFPGVFVITLAPAAIRMFEALASVK